MIPSAASQALPQASSDSREQGFYQDILENMSDGVYFVDTQRRITYWNRAASEISGYPAKEVIGHACHENLLVHTDSDGCQLCLSGCPLLATFADPQQREAQVFLKHKNGHRVAVFVQVSPIFDETGRVTGAVEVFRDDSAKLAALDRAAQMEQLALMDPLTSVGNRRYAEKRLHERAELFRREGAAYTLLFVDLDHFKAVNDTHGHDAGDAVLIATARTLEANLRTFDVLGRWGGDEFIAILATGDAASAAAVAYRCCALVQSCAVEWDGTTIRPTISIGVAVSQPGESSTDVVSRADANLYLAKQTGRDRFCGP